MKAPGPYQIHTKSGLTREELREAIYKTVPELSRESAKRILDEVFEEIISSFTRNEDVRLRGFGKFKVQHKRQRPGRNPRTLADAIIAPRRSIKFTPSRTLIARVNAGETEPS